MGARSGYGALVLLVALIACRLAEAAEPQPPEQAPTTTDAQAANAVVKFILSGPNGNLQVVGPIGTVRYYVKYCEPGPDGEMICHWECFLAQLRYLSHNSQHLYYKPLHGDPATTSWAVARRPESCGMFAVFRGTASGYRFYGYFSLAIPQ